jgi:hypothetical protein
VTQVFIYKELFPADKIVAVIVGTARFNDVIAIDIATKTEHRKKGLALMLT